MGEIGAETSEIYILQVVARDSFNLSFKLCRLPSFCGQILKQLTLEVASAKIKKNETPILKGYQLYHGFIRPHESLNGKTPSEVCGIVIEGQNKWKTLIENASRNKPKS